VASRHGQFINKSEMAAPLGLSVPTITRWLDVLEATGQILLVTPYFENFGKRLVKSPKLYLTDSGLACFLLGLRDLAALERSPYLGAVFEGYVASEIAKRQMNLGRRRELYTLRDSRGFEIDFVTVGEGLRPTFIEVKASHTVRTSDARALEKIAIEVPESDRLVLYRGDRPMPTAALVPGVQASTAVDYFGRSGA
jgi:predicted AAA+ superfamily ATPase